jgi:hypothetical protein
MGVVYGDIGTSPLYTMKEVFNGPHAVAVNPDNLLGILSLIFWALTITVSLKYVLFITRADNRGEGGIMALTSLALRTKWRRAAHAVADVGPGHLRRRAVLRRRGDHAGDVGAVGGRRAGSRHPDVQALRGADHHAA